jgi:type III secretion apparatus needle protein
VSSLNLTGLNSQLSSRVGAAESNLQSSITGGNLDNIQSLMNVQFQMAQWSTMVTLQSNTVKAVGDALKSTVQNIH